MPDRKQANQPLAVRIAGTAQAIRTMSPEKRVWLLVKAGVIRRSEASEAIDALRAGSARPGKRGRPSRAVIRRGKKR